MKTQVFSVNDQELAVTTSMITKIRNEIIQEASMQTIKELKEGKNATRAFPIILEQVLDFLNALTVKIPNKMTPMQEIWLNIC